MTKPASGPAPGNDAPDQLRRTQDLLVAITELTPAVVFCKDRSGRYTFVNQACVDLWRLPSADILGKTDFELFPAHVAASLREHDLQVFETGQAITLVEEAVFHGERHVFNSSKGPLRNAAGDVYALCGVATEITEQRVATEALLEETRRLELLNALGRTLAGELDRERLVQAAVDAGRELAGASYAAFFYTVDTEDGGALKLYVLSGAERSDFEAFPMPRDTALFGPTLRGEATVRIADVLADPRYGKNEPYGGMPEGHLPVRSYMAIPVHTRDGAVLGGLFFGHPEPGVFDQRTEALVTSIAAQASVALESAGAYEATRREIRRRAAIEEELQRANRSKDEFLAMLGHELRNPIGTLQNCVELMTLVPESDAAQRAEGVIGRQLMQLTRLVDDLLDVGRIATGRFRITRAPLDLGRVARAVAEDFGDRLANLGLHFTARVPEEPVWVEGDRARLGQAIGNLLDNAAKYTDRGGSIELSVTSGSDTAVITVVDSGDGFEREDVGDLFEAFQGTGGRDGRDGLGLGLAIVREVTERHGGSVAGRSEGKGHGAEFALRLPLMATPPEEAVSASGLRKRGSKRRRILVIDDNPAFLGTMADVLTAWGHHVVTAADGASGIQIALSQDLDVILCDIELGDAMDGYMVARRLRSLDATRDLCLVAVTGFGQDSDRERALNSGFDGHVVKPVDFEELERLLDELDPGECETGEGGGTVAAGSGR